MAISLNHAAAAQILLDEFQRVSTEGLQALDEDWKQRVDELGRLCPPRKSATFIAALGTAILGKATDVRVDEYCLLDRDGGDRSYSARSLADGVWAKHRAYLRIDLGANGANPLNNTPFIGKARIDQIENVRNQEGYAYLRVCLDELGQLTTEGEARAALRGFIASRQLGTIAAFRTGESGGDYFVLPTLAQAITLFVNEDSEDGRRAQAVAGGVLVACYGEERIILGRVNDPDRRFPLDIAIRDGPDSGGIACAIEVKDKPIDGAVLMGTIEKAYSARISNLVMLATCKSQPHEQFVMEHEFARDLGCRLECVFDWETYLKLSLGLTQAPGRGVFVDLYRCIGQTLVEIGVSEKGVADWVSLSQQRHGVQGGLRREIPET